MKKHLTHLLTGTAIATLAACGGGGGGGTNTTASSRTLSGVVMDGYLTGATVCLDTNANLLCDDDEPTAKSQTKGTWSFNIPAGTDTSKLHIIAVIDANTIDADTGTAPIQSYTLLTPATASNVVTPLTTLVSHKLIESPGLTLAQARAHVITDSNLPAETKFDEDYVANSNTKTHNVAKLIADVLGQSTAAVNTAATPSSNSEKGATVKIALTQAKTQVAAYAQQAANAANETDLKTLRSSAKTATQTAITSDASISDLVKSTATLGTPKLANLSNALNNGGMFAIWQSINCLTGGSCTAGATYEQIYATDSTHVVTQKHYAPKGNSTWGAAPPQQATRYIANTNTNTWVKEPSSNRAIAMSNDGLSGVFTNTETNSSMNVSTTELDISGKRSKSVATLLKSACSAISVTSITSICNDILDFTFPAGSKIFVNTFYQNAPEYTLWDCPTCGLSISNGDTYALSYPNTLNELITKASIDNINQSAYFGGAVARFDKTKNKVFLFDYDTKTPLASGTYQIQTIAGLPVLSISIISVETPEKWFNSNDRDKYALNAILVEREGKVLNGRKVDAGTTTNAAYINRTAADALMKVLDYPVTLN
jgi:hypothetical protein